MKPQAPETLLVALDRHRFPILDFEVRESDRLHGLPARLCHRLASCVVEFRQRDLV